MSGPPPLPRGITGFHSIGDRLPQVKFAGFKRACYGVAMSIGAHVGTAQSAEHQVKPNFHWAEVQTSTGTVYVLCNVRLPWVALTAADPQGAALQFSENAELLEAWASQPGFRMLDVAYLEAAPASDVL